MPVAMANTFLTAPPISTPIGSSLAYTRSVGPCSALTVCATSAASLLAATSAVG